MYGFRTWELELGDVQWARYGSGRVGFKKIWIGLDKGYLNFILITVELVFESDSFSIQPIENPSKNRPHKSSKRGPAHLEGIDLRKVLILGGQNNRLTRSVEDYALYPT